jgi:putative FmdB family regulatory protein
MPLYEYSCPRCGEKKELLVRSPDAAAEPVCPSCGVPMAKEWAPVVTHSKGGGGNCSPSRGGFS